MTPCPASLPWLSLTAALRTTRLLSSPQHWDVYGYGYLFCTLVTGLSHVHTFAGEFGIFPVGVSRRLLPSATLRIYSYFLGTSCISSLFLHLSMRHCVGVSTGAHEHGRCNVVEAPSSDRNLCAWLRHVEIVHHPSSYLLTTGNSGLGAPVPVWSRGAAYTTVSLFCPFCPDLNSIGICYRLGILCFSCVRSLRCCCRGFSCLSSHTRSRQLAFQSNSVVR